MSNTIDYIDQFGSKSFEEYPFCDADALSICEMFYSRIEKVVSESFDDSPVDFISVANKLFAMNNFYHKPLGLMITANPTKRLMQMASTRRFSSLRVLAVKDVYSQVPAIQFTAGTFLLPDDTAVIVFRGTDDTISGWKEDIDILVNQGTPAYKIAGDYLENAASHLSGDIILCGHSKGGNEALHTALCCNPDIRKRIKYIHNFDGPGFHSYDIYRTGSYDEVIDRYHHFIPTNSLIGKMMAHDYDYKAVKSSRLLGPFQHDVGTWKIDNGDLVTVEGTDKLSDLYDILLAKLASGCLAGNYYKSVSEVLERITVGTNCKTLLDFAKNLAPSLKGAKDAWKSIDSGMKDEFKDAFGNKFKYLRESIKCVKDNAVEETVKSLFDSANEFLK